MDEKLVIGKWTVTPTECSISDGDITFHIEPKSMDLLILLASSDGELVSREKIMEVVWKDRVVTEYALNNLISGLRKKLNTKGEKEAYIITRPKLGYQLIAPVKRLQAPIPESLSSSSTVSVRPQKSKIEVGVTQQPSQHRSGLYLFGAFALVVLFAFVYFFTTQSTQNGNVAPESSIAVLPFDVYDNEKDIAYFADGLAEEIIHQLTILPNLKVISRTSSFSFRNKEIPITEIADRLDVAYVLEGSVRKANDTMRVTLQLINAEDDAHVWSKVFVASTENRFSVQHQISSEIAHSIDASFVEIPDDLKIFTPESSEAYLRVLKGRKLNQTATPEAYVQARDEFLMATLLEPEYADAHVDLAVSYLLLLQNKRLKQEEALPIAIQSIERALQINPELASAYAAQGIMNHMIGESSKAIESFEKALEINPDHYLALINFANFLRQNARSQEALEHYMRAKELAPMSGDAHWGVGNVLLNLGKIDEGTKRYEECLVLLPDNLNCMYGYAYGLRLSNRSEEANEVVSEFDRVANKNDYWYRSVTGFHYLWKGEFETANEIYEGMIEQFGVKIEALQSVTLTKVRLNETQKWFDRLSSIIESQQNLGVAVHANYALSAYYSGNCDAGIETFEKIVKHRFPMVEDPGIIINAINYLAMLAHCYEQQGRNEEMLQTLQMSEEILSQMPENSSFIGGLVFSKAQVALLNGDNEKAQELVSQLVSNNWELAWLVERDPVLSALATEG